MRRSALGGLGFYSNKCCTVPYSTKVLHPFVQLQWVIQGFRTPLASPHGPLTSRQPSANLTGRQAGTADTHPPTSTEAIAHSKRTPDDVSSMVQTSRIATTQPRHVHYYAGYLYFDCKYVLCSAERVRILYRASITDSETPTSAHQCLFPFR